MNTTCTPRRAQLGILLAAASLALAAGCDEAVVGKNFDGGPTVDAATGDASAVTDLCQELGQLICDKACECGGADGCNVGHPVDGTDYHLSYDDQAACEASYVTAACQSPPHPASYYENCLATVSQCMSVPDGAGTVSAVELPPDCQNPNGFGIRCGADTCTRLPLASPDNEKCCVVVDGDDSVPMCMAQDDACEPLDLSLSCDGPEDCGGTACCGSVTTGVACITEADCPTDVAQYCHTSDDCRDGELCIPASYAGFEFQVCADVGP